MITSLSISLCLVHDWVQLLVLPEDPVLPILRILLVRLGGVGVRVVEETGLPTELVLLPDDDSLELLVVVLELGDLLDFLCLQALLGEVLPALILLH